MTTVTQNANCAPSRHTPTSRQQRVKGQSRLQLESLGTTFLRFYIRKIWANFYLSMASLMAVSRPFPTEGPSAVGTEFDDLDDLFDYDVRDENDPFSDNYKPPNKKEPVKEVATKTSKNDTGLGIDEEVEVSKKIRVPRVKLDEHRYFFAIGLLGAVLTVCEGSYQRLEFLS